MSEQKVHSSIAQRIIMKFLSKEDTKTSQIYARLKKQFGDECLSQSRVYEWCKAFKESRIAVENETHVRWPRTLTSDDKMSDVDALIRGDRRITVRSMATKLNISVGSVEILIKGLKYSKVSARWVPRLLNPEHKEKILIAATQLLQRFEKNRVNFLESIVTCDET